MSAPRRRRPLPSRGARVAPAALPAASAMLVAALLCLGGAAEPAADDDVVLRWNRAVGDCIVLARTPPAVAARAYAIVHTCVFDAWATYDRVARGTQLGDGLRRPPDDGTAAHKRQAISFAAYRALADLFPGLRPTVLDPLMCDLGYDPGDESSDLGSPSGIGNVACRAVLAFRRHDGANQSGDLHPGAYSDYTGYTPANTADLLADPDRWQPLAVGGAVQRWQLPHWGRVVPFALRSGAQFRPYLLARGPYRYASPRYRQQALDVIGQSAGLSDTEKVIAEYWADGAGTVTPPGHWNAIAAYVSRRDRLGLDREVKLFFVLGNALMDTGIATWDVKRASDSIRPVSVIRSALGMRTIVAWAGPGAGVRAIDCKDFRSYLATPPFASYVSGHSAFSAAAAEVLKRFTGSDRFGGSFTALPGSSAIERGATPAAPVTLSWPTFSAAADQAGMSRRWGGIHFESDDLAGRELGRMVAMVVWDRASAYIGNGGEAGAGRHHP